MIYQKFFAEYNQVAAQILMTRNTMINPKNRRHAQDTFGELLNLGAIPVVNANDSISTFEILHGDNDTLSAIVASLVDADLLILLSDTTAFTQITRTRTRTRSLSPSWNI